MFAVNPLPTVAEAQRLVAHQRGHRVVQSREAGEIDRGNSKIKRRGGDAGNSQVSRHIVLERIVAQHARAAATPVQLHGFHQARRPVMRQPQRDGLAQSGLRAGRIRKIAKGILALGAQVVAAVQAEFGIDGVQDVQVQSVAVDWHCGLQQIILHRAGQIRQGIEREQASRGCIDRWNLATVAQWSPRTREIRKGIEERNSQAAEIAAAFGRRRHRRIVVQDAGLRFVLIVDEEKSLVAAIIYVGNFQRTAQVAAKAFVIVAGLRNGIARNRIRSGVPNGIFVAVVETEADAIHRLPIQSAAPAACKDSAATRAASARSSAESAASATGSAKAARSAGSSASRSATAGPATSSARSLSAWSTFTRRIAGNQSVRSESARSISRQALADRSLQ